MSFNLDRQWFAYETTGTPYARSAVTTAERIQLPGALRDTFVIFQARGVAVYVRFGDDTVNVDHTVTSGLSSEALTADGKEPHLHIASGKARRVYVPPDGVTHFAHISPGTGGVLYFARATSPVG